MAHGTTDYIVGRKFEGKWAKPGESPICLVSVSGQESVPTYLTNEAFLLSYMLLLLSY